MSTQPAFVCPKCHKASWHPMDGEQGFCGACHEFTGRDGFNTNPVAYLATDPDMPAWQPPVLNAFVELGEKFGAMGGAAAQAATSFTSLHDAFMAEVHVGPTKPDNTMLVWYDTSTP